MKDFTKIHALLGKYHLGAEFNSETASYDVYTKWSGEFLTSIPCRIAWRNIEEVRSVIETSLDLNRCFGL